MDITVKITQEAHDCVLSQLRKKVDAGDPPDLTVQQWLQDAIDGKVNWCMKKTNPVAVLEAEKSALEARIAELEAA
tara:strand:+ start:3521 stop:3748 length:228 start_codon:yes stop_codon:yes gene_type:complete